MNIKSALKVKSHDLRKKEKMKSHFSGLTLKLNLIHHKSQRTDLVHSIKKINNFCIYLKTDISKKFSQNRNSSSFY